MRRSVLLGIDYSRASLEVREGLSFTPAQCAEFYAHLSTRSWPGELIILSTCNRSEFLLAGADLEAAETQLLAALRAWRPSARALDDDCVRYRYVDEACVRHTMSVASGLASRVKGDAQIAHQFRQAAETSSQAARCGPVLNTVVQAALRTARRVRRETGIGCGAASTGAAVLGAIRSRLGDCQPLRVLLLGAGQVAADTLAHLSKQRFAHLGVAARRVEAALELTRSYRSTTPIDWARRETEIQAADAVIAAVSEPLECLRAERLAQLRCGSSRPILLIDLGVPRAVDPLCQSLPGVSLLDVDRIQTELAAAQQTREAGARHAEFIVAEELAKYARREREQSVEPAIRDLYRDADRIRRRILASPGLDQGESTRRLMKSLLDGPVRRLRQLASSDASSAGQAAWVLSVSNNEKRETAL